MGLEAASCGHVLKDYLADLRQRHDRVCSCQGKQEVEKEKVSLGEEIAALSAKLTKDEVDDWVALRVACSVSHDLDSRLKVVQQKCIPC